MAEYLINALHRSVATVLNIPLTAAVVAASPPATEDDRKHWATTDGTEKYDYHQPDSVRSGSNTDPLVYTLGVLLKGSFSQRYWGQYNQDHSTRANVPNEALFPFFNGTNGSNVNIEHIPFVRVAVKVFFRTQQTTNVTFKMIRATTPHYLKFTCGEASCSLDRLLAETLFDPHSRERLPSHLLGYDEMREYHEAQDYAKYELPTYGLISQLLHNPANNQRINQSVLTKYRNAHVTTAHERKFFSKTFFPTADDPNVNAAVAVAHALVFKNTLHLPTLLAHYNSKYGRGTMFGYGAVVAQQEYDLDAIADATGALCSVVGTGGMVAQVSSAEAAAATEPSRDDYVLNRVLPFVGCETRMGRDFVRRQLYASADNADVKTEAFCKVWTKVFAPYLLRRAIIQEMCPRDPSSSSVAASQPQNLQTEPFDNSRYVHSTNSRSGKPNNITRVMDVIRAAMANPSARKCATVDKFVHFLNLEPQGNTYEYMTHVCSNALVLSVYSDPNDVMMFASHCDEDPTRRSSASAAAAAQGGGGEVSTTDVPTARLLHFRIPLDYIHYLCVHGIPRPSNYIIPNPVTPQANSVTPSTDRQSSAFQNLTPAASLSGNVGTTEGRPPPNTVNFSERCAAATRGGSIRRGESGGAGGPTTALLVSIPAVVATAIGVVAGTYS